MPPVPTPYSGAVSCTNPDGDSYPTVEAPVTEHDTFALAPLPTPQPDPNDPTRTRCMFSAAQQLNQGERLLALPNKWKIALPWGPTRFTTFELPANDGWAVDARQDYACELGGWCPYACKPGFIETQYDDYVGQPYHLSTSADGWVGSGRRLATVGSGSQECSGGNIGLFCDEAGSLRVKAPSKKATHGVAYTERGFSKGYRRKLCRLTPGVTLANTAPSTITACRTVFPGTEIPQIPIEVAGNGSQPLTILPDDGRWWKSGKSVLFGTLDTAPIEYFVSRMDEPNHPDCVWDTVRPSCAPNPLLGEGVIPPSCGFAAGPNGGGVDFYPYIIGVQQGTGDFIINTNNDYTANWFGVYDPALGHPGYGMAAYDESGTLLGAVEWCGGYKRSLRAAGGDLACSQAEQQTSGLLCGYDTTNSVATTCAGKGFAADPTDATCRALYDTTKLSPRAWNPTIGAWTTACTFTAGAWSSSCQVLFEGLGVLAAKTIAFYPLALPHQCTDTSAPPAAPLN